ncbi:unnamed protein product [Pelagomonas calceolata]|uniref:Uncharacterized protein n=1 Tax=Pelagomonas calceolata TaxID=35677 RepID=A0A8J2SKZ1_9STRA|nr:unnamed protein product [Pelagomonas calceolata]|mmetsp:Transcript_5819/g.17331  ORF Transcript_5819/g.17331 Transcript_5819/m.17331 type:complete len:169 (+) Transcript_5819:79-585(+)
MMRRRSGRRLFHLFGIAALTRSSRALLAIPTARRRAAPLMAEGRGVDHLSAALEEGDLVLYQTGQWAVDGVTIGDGEPALAYAVVDTLQLVFTHNCEHGWIYGSALERDDSDGSLRPPDGDAFVQLGPEQLLARLDGDALGDGVSYELGDAGRRAVEEARVRLASWGD